ncbi:MAG TPA: FAD-dependent monooxygenase, partial [Burkholderiales bacterium]|nr:FAD-dependent monooxygenase [Burkholderiales bacterium]
MAKADHRASLQPASMPGYSLPVYEYRRPPELSGQGGEVYPVIVVGAGLAGLTAALELGSRGIRTVILDEDNTVGAAGLSSRGICYAKRSLEILDRFGVASRIRAKGVTWNEGEVYRGEARIYRFNLQPESDQKFPAFVNLQQFYVEQYLVEAIAAVPAVDLRWRSKVVSVENGTDGVALGVETPEGRYEARAQYVVAADGGHSTLRELLGAEDEERSFYEDRWCIADVRIEAREEPVRKAYLDGIPTQGGAIWYHQMADGVWRTDWQIGHLPDPDAEVTPERAVERLKKLLGPGVRFELVWVGPWRFKKRLLKRFVHGRVLFAGDAAHEHSPFGARGGNSGIQDANNLAWKLALVLQGKAAPALLDTYQAERHFAARDNTEAATRSAIFIGPESDGQRLFRDAILDLAQRESWCQPWVNVGRLSVATLYRDSALNAERGEFASDRARPGAAAPDGRFGEGFFVERLQGEFTVAWFGAEGPALEARTLVVRREGHEALFERYGVRDTATYVFRPDGHVLARCTGIDPAFAREAIARVLGERAAGPPANAATNQP